MNQEVIEITEREIEVIEVIEKGLIGPTGPQANINYTVVTANQTLTNSQNIAADTSGGSFTLTLPASPNAGDSIDIFDYANTFDTNPLTIARNGQPIESLAENLTANVEGAYFTLIYTGVTRGWQILPRYGVSGIEDVLSAQGDLLYRGASSETRLPIGTAGQVLKVNSGATAPEWGSISGSISVTGSDLTLSGTTGTAITNATLANSGVVAGTYTKVTVDAKGRATVGASATKSDVGLGNVDNTSDANKPVSTATQTALNLKANLDSPALTGTPTAPTASAGTNTTQVATTAFTLANRGDRYLTTSTSSHSITTGSKTFTVQSGLSYTATQDVTIVYDGDPTNKHMHATVTSYSGTTLVVNVESVQGSGGPFTAWTINVGGLLTAQGALLEANNLSDVANSATALTNIGGVPTSRTITAGTGLTGGGDLTANRTLTVSYGTTSGTACEGNDARLSDARTPLSHVHAASDVTSGVFDNARINWAAPSAIGSTTSAAGAFTNLTASAELQLPTNAPASPSAGDLYRVTDTLRYRDSSNTERILLSGAGNLANLTDAATARTNLGLGTFATANAASPPAIGSTTPAAISGTTGTFTTLTANNGTIATSAPALTLSQTWNALAQTFHLCTIGITNATPWTASAAGSTLFRAQIGGSTVFSVDYVGTCTTAGLISTGAISTNSSLQFSSNVSFRAGTSQALDVWTAGALDVRLWSVGNPANAATNFERLFLRGQTGGAFLVGTEKGGTGSARALEFRTDGTTRLTLGAAGGVTLNSGNLVLTDNTGSETATFDAQGKLSTNRTYNLPDASGTLALTSNTTTNLWIPASAWIPRTTNGCGVDSREIGSTNRQNFDELLFDPASDEFAQALVEMPNNYNNGTITARFFWTAASGSGAVVWGIQGRAFGDDDAIDQAHGTAQTVTDTLLASNDMHVSDATSAVTIGGTPAANTPIQFQIYRDADAAGDTLAVDARLLGVEIIFN